MAVVESSVMSPGFALMNCLVERSLSMVAPKRVPVDLSVYFALFGVAPLQCSSGFGRPVNHAQPRRRNLAQWIECLPPNAIVYPDPAPA